MSILQFLASLAWTASAVLFLARLDRWANRWLSVHEQRYASNAPIGEGTAEPMPADLMGYIHAIQTGNAEMDGEMREQTLSVLYEQYAALGSWDKVRMWSASNLASDPHRDGWVNA